MMATFWMSFCDPEKPRGSQFLGVALVDAASFPEAMTVSHMSGCNPGGEIQFVEFDDDLMAAIPDERRAAMDAAPRNTLMNRDELSRYGLDD